MLNKIKIIGGQWKGRSIDFPETPGLRPTPSRIRETLFNWLAPIIHDAVFLDAFGGSGALSFEALSRGASRGVFIEEARLARKYCQLNAEKLNTDMLHITPGRSPERFSSLKHTQAFDIVFLDPPFFKKLLAPCLQALLKDGLLHPNSVIYFESEKELDLSPLIEGHFNLVKKLEAGKVSYGLLTLKTD
jgi:16S rRNA (guanine966-N2)-methyltransferase